jgi:hypothetical protein
MVVLALLSAQVLFWTVAARDRDCLYEKINLNTGTEYSSLRLAGRKRNRSVWMTL